MIQRESSELSAMFLEQYSEPLILLSIEIKLNSARSIVNDNHDEQGRFSSSDHAGAAKEHGEKAKDHAEKAVKAVGEKKIGKAEKHLEKAEHHHSVQKHHVGKAHEKAHSAGDQLGAHAAKHHESVIGEIIESTKETVEVAKEEIEENAEQ